MHVAKNFEIVRSFSFCCCFVTVVDGVIDRKRRANVYNCMRILAMILAPSFQNHLMRWSLITCLQSNVHLTPHLHFFSRSFSVLSVRFVWLLFVVNVSSWFQSHLILFTSNKLLFVCFLFHSDCIANIMICWTHYHIFSANSTRCLFFKGWWEIVMKPFRQFVSFSAEIPHDAVVHWPNCAPFLRFHTKHFQVFAFHFLVTLHGGWCLHFVFLCKKIAWQLDTKRSLNVTHSSPRNYLKSEHNIRFRILLLFFKNDFDELKKTK